MNTYSWLRCLAAICLGALLLAACGASGSGPGPLLQATPAPPPGPQEAMFRGNAQHTGVYNVRGPFPNAELKWKFPAASLVLAPAVAADVAFFVADYKTLYAVDINSGLEQWHLALHVGQKTGQQLAHLATAPSPAVVGGIVYVGDEQTDMFALDAKTGQEKWSHKSAAGLCDSATPVVVHDTVYFGCYGGQFYALDAQTGHEKWTRKLEAAYAVAPATSNDVVYVSGGPTPDFFFGADVDSGPLYALDAVTGQEKWKTTIPKGVASSPVIADGFVYVRNVRGELYALEAGTGREHWHFQTAGAGLSAPAVAAGILYVGSLGGTYQAVDIQSGKEKWQLKTAPDSTSARQGLDGLYSSPSIAEGVVYLSGFDQNLYALDAQSGQLKWKVGIEGFIQSAPVVTEGMVFVGSKYGLHALQSTARAPAPAPTLTQPKSGPADSTPPGAK